MFYSSPIGTFDKRGQENQENNINNEFSGANDISNNTTNITQTNSAAVELAALKKMRRNSLQIHFDPSDQLIKTAEDIGKLKLMPKKYSTGSICTYFNQNFWYFLCYNRA